MKINKPLFASFIVLAALLVSMLVASFLATLRRVRHRPRLVRE